VGSAHRRTGHVDAVVSAGQGVFDVEIVFAFDREDLALGVGDSHPGTLALASALAGNGPCSSLPPAVLLWVDNSGKSCWSARKQGAGRGEAGMHWVTSNEALTDHPVVLRLEHGHAPARALVA
jgi:hypothetical protein